MPATIDDPSALTPDQRRREIAALLARGILRLGNPRQLAPESTESRLTEEALESVQNGLELSAMSRPPVARG